MADFGKLNFSVSFNPTSAFPLDARYYFSTLAAAQEAAKTAVEVGSAESVYYIGQNLVVVESDKATLYVIQPNKELKAVGTVPLGDEKSIEVSPEGVITLKGLADAETGAYPAKQADGSIKWIKPDTSTVDGLSQEMAAVKGRVDTLEGVVGNDGAGLVKDVADLKTAVDGKQATITGAATTIVADNLDADKVVISNTDGKVAVSAVTATELSYLAGVTGGIQSQIDNIPKYNYKDAVEISVADGSEQDAINAEAVKKLKEAYAAAKKWDAVTVSVTLTPSDVKKDALYFYNGNAWVFLHYVTTGVQRANGEVAGIVENSDDITFVDGKGTVVAAGKVKNKLKAGAKEFDGSAPVEITAEDLGALTAVPDTFVKKTDIATDAAVGVVKGSADNNKIKVEADGTMTVNSVEANKIVGAVAEASKLTNAVTVQKNGQDVDSFDGSVAKTINIEVPTASTDLSDSSTLLRFGDKLILNCGDANTK